MLRANEKNKFSLNSWTTFACRILEQKSAFFDAFKSGQKDCVFKFNNVWKLVDY